MAYLVRHSTRTYREACSTDTYHVIYRRHDNLPCHGRIYGPGNYGRVYVFCFVCFTSLFGKLASFDGSGSTIISQLVYSAGASGFAAANGSMMIEVVVSQSVDHRLYQSLRSIQPFFHIMATRIAQDIGEGNEREIVVTTLVAFAFSSILTGMTY
jgi:hypothetical protein